MGIFKKIKEGMKEKIDINLSAGYSPFIQRTEPLNNSAFWSCIVNLSRLYATLPLHVFVRSNGEMSQKSEGLLVELMKKPNPYMDSYKFRFVMGFNFEMHGQAVAIIDRASNGLPKGLYPVSPNQVVGYWSAGDLYYTYAPNGTRYHASDMLIIDNTPSGYTSVLDPIYFARTELDLEEKCKKLQLEYYSGATIVGHTISVPAGFKKEQKDEIRMMFDSSHGFRNYVIDERVKVTPIQVNSGDVSKLNSAQEWNASEVARRFNVPPFFIGDTKGTYANAEQQGLNMVIYCLQPRIGAWEQAIEDAVCFNNQYVRFSLQGLMRGDHAARSSFYHNALLDGWMSINEVRRLEELPPIGDDGDVHFFPMNYGTLSDIIAGKYASGTSTSIWNNPSEKVQEQHTIIEKKKKDLAFLSESRKPITTNRSKLEKMLKAQLKKEVAEIKRLVATGASVEDVLSDFKSWLDQEAKDLQPQYKTFLLEIIEKMLPTVQKEVGSDQQVNKDSMSDFADSYAISLTGRHTGYVYKQIRKNVGSDDFEATCTNLEQDYAIAEAKEEVNRSSNAFNVFLFGALGVEEMHVVASADACPFCSSLDGKIVSVKGYVLRKGDNQDDGQGSVRKIDKNYRHPPFHTYCSCGVAPGR